MPFSAGLERTMAAKRVIGLITLSALAGACSVDDRVLALGISVTAGGVGPQGGAASGGSTRSKVGGASGGNRLSELGGAGGNGPPGTAGAAGDAPLPPPIRCPDLNQNMITDCDETLATNATFDREFTGWKPDPDVLQTWSSVDSNRFPTSGALTLSLSLFSDQSDTAVGESSTQCIPVSSGTAYDVGTQVFIKSGQGSFSYAGLQLWWYGALNCVESSFLAASANDQSLKETVDRWTEANIHTLAPANAKSVLVRLAISKPYKQRSLEASFDNVLFAKH